jgi:hypothetical protein
MYFAFCDVCQLIGFTSAGFDLEKKRAVKEEE